jgi:subtilisin
MASAGDFFKELFQRLDRDRLLRDPAADGSGVKVALVDTGVDAELIAQRCRERGHEPPKIEGVIFGPAGEVLPYSGRHSATHGTTVADIILQLAPRVQLFTADVFGGTGNCTVEKLVQALHWSVTHWQCKLINISLGVAEERLQSPARRYALWQALQFCYSRDVILVAAAHNDHPLILSWPAIHTPPLLSVRKGELAAPLQFRYAPDTFTEFQAHSRAYYGPFANTLATSWAAAHLTGIVARLLSLKPDLKPFEVKTLLYWLGDTAPGQNTT